MVQRAGPAPGGEAVDEGGGGAAETTAGQARKRLERDRIETSQDR